MSAPLVEYGIQTEGSDKRAHVCPVVRRIYVYPTKPAVKYIMAGRYREVTGFQAGVSGPTARGFLVPPMHLPQCIGIEIRDSIWDIPGFREDMSTTEKGKNAVSLVECMILLGLFPLPSTAREVTDRNLQIQGADIILPTGVMFERDYVIQVKCDYTGGPEYLGGTGNLFIQTAERNPLGLH